MRGEKSRFQLFGDTVNTAARIESTGMRDKIHLSAETAEQLIQAGKQNWVELRDTKVEAKGKGKLQTYWLVMSVTSPIKSNQDPASPHGNHSSNSFKAPGQYAEDEASGSLDGHRSFGGGVNGLVAMFEKVEKLNTLDERTRRQAEYTVKLMTQILKKIVAQRWGVSSPLSPTPIELQRFSDMEATVLSNNSGPLKEVGDTIDFGSFLIARRTAGNIDTVELPKVVLHQLEDFVTTIASMYQHHAFHCWEHASHVTISLTKLYSRLASSCKQSSHEKSMAGHRQWNRRMPKGSNKGILDGNNNPSFGITNDPLTEFALVFAAMIHDVDHPGLSNARVVKDNSTIAHKYGKRSPIELHSLQSAWSVFQRPSYQELRRHIYSSEQDMKRFRQLVVILVMATDITDRDTAKEREKRWDRAFSSKKNLVDSETINQRATLVLETMMQAANIAHCTQHWNVFTKWNKRLFQEIYEGYKAGRRRDHKDPTEFWYERELEFFDQVVIPLGIRLNESGAFGDDAEEFVAYAKSNRRDWEAKGRDMINEYLADGVGLKSIKHSSNISTSSVALWSSEENIKLKPTYAALKVAMSSGNPSSNTSPGPPNSVTKKSPSVAARWPPPPKKIL